ncbi:MAG TPA: tripartite tricarboxylate transporter substrate binding protein [Burkholderiales bacterium]|nr:tripartite tricarboxylate transporter substrate binding protein [Burkholderiales bacterium]
MRSTSLPYLLKLSVSLITLTACASVPAQNYPNRPIRYVVAFAPGGINDILARIVGQKLSEITGQSVIVDNRPGAGGNLGTELVAKSSPDGYTLLNISTAQAISATLYSKLGYNLERDLAPVALLGSSPLIIAIHPGVNARNVAEFAAASKQKPLSYASGGIGTISHLSGEMLKRALGFDMTHVPYKGAGPAIADLMGGQVQMMINAVPELFPTVKAGRMRCIGVMAEKRHPFLPDIPTLIEQGHKEFVMGNWVGVVAATGTPKDAISKLSTEINRIMKQPDVVEKLTQQGFDPVQSTPESFGRHVRAETARFGKAVKESGARVD